MPGPPLTEPAPPGCCPRSFSPKAGPDPHVAFASFVRHLRARLIR